MIKINLKNYSFYTIFSVILILIGIGLWLDWIIKYGVVYDVGIYSLVIVFLIPGIVGFIISLMDKKTIED
ncbi:MAG: hypothetical protein JSV67_06110 [Thermoplasmatales archaeon]|nr:MAG: hypothetical protein JSV67_06110 [Thermoplasmatales archaeon]